MSAVTVIVTAAFAAEGGPFPSGVITFQLTEDLRDPAGPEMYPAVEQVGTVDYQGRLIDRNGNLGVGLVANDSPGLTPAGTRYFVTIRLVGAPDETAYVVVPAAAAGGTIDLAALLAA